MQLTVFSTDEQKAGFRLQYMEVFNWGTFDGKVWSIEPGGETSLLTGANGSGKTTFVDALLTLIVPERRMRFYNQSSGSEKKGDRSEETYVLGAYGTVPADSGTGLKTLYLREDRESAYSILLASFANEAGQAVTLFQVRYFGSGEMKRVYGIAHKALRVETDFKPFDLSGAWKRRLEQQYNRSGARSIEWPHSASQYAQRLTEVLGMQSIQALSLFNQTVGIKVLGDLNEFIRTNMLEPRDMELQFQELKKHLATLIDAQRNIEKIALQISLLQPLQQHYQQFRDSSEKLELAQLEAEIVTVWQRYTQYHLLVEATATQEAELKALQQQLETAKLSLEQLAEAERQTQNQIDQNGAGQRLQQLQQELDELVRKKNSAEKALAHFTEWCTQLHLPETEPVDEAAYQRIKKEVRVKGLQLERLIRLNEEDLFEAKHQLGKAEKELKDINADLEVLLLHRNNIPGHLISIRKNICDALKLETSELPFAGELMQVKAEELDWQPALEKLLHGFALRLLVPEKHYKKVARYVNNTDLRTRLVYYAVQEGVHFELPEPGTVYHKLEFLQEHKLWKWVAQQVQRNYGHFCLENESELERYDFAITLNGLVKTRDRHEKDDRAATNDPSRYVMGWNNEKKKDHLQRRRQTLLQAQEVAKDIEEKARRKADRLQKDLYAQQRLSEHEGFAGLNTAAIHRQIGATEAALQELQDSNDQLKSLKAQLESLRSERAAVSRSHDSLIEVIGKTKDRLESMLLEQEQLQPFVQFLTEGDKDGLLQFQQRHGEKVAGLTLQTLAQCYRQLKEDADAEASGLAQQKLQAEREVERAITRIKSPALETLQRFTDWAADVQHLPAQVVHAQEYVEWLERLETDNLPRYKREFENLMHDTASYKIGALHTALEEWETRIRQSIATLNASLEGINFNRLPDTFIKLEYRPVPDTAIKEFRHNLLAALPNEANWQQSDFAEKELHFRQQIQPLIARLDESESYRARVLDVRNWFEFWANEFYRNTGELKKAYRQMGQLSGGEKAQLTYTILCSAIAYQFGITREGHNARSLRFIAVDESFSNQDEEKATYLMELCKQLHLQLLVVTPSDKIQIVEQFIAHVHLVQRRAGRESILFNMTQKELKEKREAVADGAQVSVALQ